MKLANAYQIFLALCALFWVAAEARKPSILFSSNNSHRQTQQAQLCLAGAPGPEICAVNPALAFKTGLVTTTLPDRLYKTFMAQHVLCPRILSQERCLTDPALQCAWNPRKQRCEADKYASYLMPMSCPASAAKAFLMCMRKPNEEACKADGACYPEQKSACLPKTMLAQAKAANIPVHTLAEQVALGILTGNTSVIGSCSEAQLLKSMSAMCPHHEPWSSCNQKFCAFDVPPYLPHRPPTPRAGNNRNNAHQTSQYPAVPPPPAKDISSSGLTYYGTNPGPICSIDADKLPTLLHEVLQVSKGLADSYITASKTCKEADEIWMNAKQGTTGCGTSTFEYDMDFVQEAAAVTAGDLLAPAQNDPAAAALSFVKKLGVNINLNMKQQVVTALQSTRQKH